MRILRVALARAFLLAAALLSLLASEPARAMSIYLNDQNISVALISPGSLTGGTLGNVIDATSPTVTETHTQGTHVWVSGGSLELRFDLGADYDLETFHFWNYFSEDFDVDTIDLTFLDAGDSSVGSLALLPALGPSPSAAEDFPLVGIENVRFVSAVLAGSNDQVDFQNIGFTGTQVPEPSTALLLGTGLALTASMRRRSTSVARRFPTIRR